MSQVALTRDSICDDQVDTINLLSTKNPGRSSPVGGRKVAEGDWGANRHISRLTTWTGS
jgi:hypothetical protein